VGREALSVVWATGRSFSLSFGCGDGTANPYRSYSATDGLKVLVLTQQEGAKIQIEDDDQRDKDQQPLL
jgi:hypothetical protein